ncbi:MAG TPA: MBOAT family O-acyltransferase [Bacteroidia bacterium]|nr:MBOAT family O-acyltransferase [Bacteroidia bacterium]
MIENILHIIFTYNDEPLLFTHLFFWLFLLVVLFFYSIVYNLKDEKVIWKILYLVLTSFYFYYKTSGVFIIILWYVIIVDFLLGKKIANAQNVLHKKIYLGISIANSLLLLGYFKYSYFIVESVNQLFHTSFTYVNYFSIFTNEFFNTHFDIDKLIFPVGISFFLFQTMSYVIDVYQKKVDPLDSIVDYAFFVSFFPHLVAGPIVKAHDFIYQIRMPYQLSIAEFKQAWLLIMKGLSKKIIADFMAIQMIDKIFDNPNYFTAYENFLAIIGYSYQVYADFSGYTDIAIGIALLFGYRLKKNFNYPYKAQSPSEFWKRWHISLSSWLKEYLYIPLGGNRSITVASYIVLFIIMLFLILLFGNITILFILIAVFLLFFVLSRYNEKFRRVFEQDINIMVTMLLGGLWHGSSWLFVIWGGLNGLAVVIHKQWEKISPFKNSQNIFVKFSLMITTLLFISYTRIFFRSQTLENAIKMNEKIFSKWNFENILPITTHYADVLILLLLCYIFHWLPEKWKETIYNSVTKLPIALLAILSCVIVLLLYQLMASNTRPFIYFQF